MEPSQPVSPDKPPELVPEPEPVTTPQSSRLRLKSAEVAAWLLVLSARLLTGLRGIWDGCVPSTAQTVYFANHTSHGDFVLVWAALPSDLRCLTRPVAGLDYWNTSRMRRFIANDVFNALMISRDGSGGNAVELMTSAVVAGDSLIMFPEGTRNVGDDVLLPLRSGLFHLATACPDARFVPVWLENLKRVLPKGAMVPIPLACSVRFGAPLALGAAEEKAVFMARARQALLDLRPEYDRLDDERA